jgi:hypothetical protein
MHPLAGHDTEAAVDVGEAAQVAVLTVPLDAPDPGLTVDDDEVAGLEGVRF